MPIKPSQCLAGLLALAGAASADPPNVLFIAVDDLRPELGCYGADYMQTPNLDTLASQGRMFRNHYVQVPTCGASRYAMFTGLRPTAASDDNDAFVLHMPTSQGTNPESWVELLRRNGWHTASLGKITHEPDGYRWIFPVSYDSGRTEATWPEMRFSWDEIIWDHGKWGAECYPLFTYADGTGRVKYSSPAWECGTNSLGQSVADEAYPDGRTAQAAIDKLREFAQDNTRFCLAVGFFRPHLPFNAPKHYYDLYNPATLPPPTPAAAPINNNYVGSSGEIGVYTDYSDTARLRHAYFASVSYVDAQIGKVIDELNALGLADNTVIVLWGDHGWCLGEYGGQLGKHRVLEHALESPLIIRAPRAWNPECYAGVPATGLVETIDIYPTIAELCGLTPPSGPGGTSLVPMLRNPFAAGKDSAYARFISATTVRTPDWRLIDNGAGAQDLYDLSTYRYETEDVSASHPAVVSELDAKLNVQGVRSGTTYIDWTGGDPALVDPLGDADGDGAVNLVEYGAGTDPKDPVSKSAGRAVVDGGEVSLILDVSSTADDVALQLDSRTNLLSGAWSFQDLEFVEAIDQGDGTFKVRYRSVIPNEPHRFFRTGLIYE